MKGSCYHYGSFFNELALTHIVRKDDSCLDRIGVFICFCFVFVFLCVFFLEHCLVGALR